MDIAIILIRRCKANDQEAFNQLFREYDSYLYRVCYFYCQNKEEALDIMQEVYIRIFRHIEKFDEKRPLLPWLKRIAVNTCLNYKRDHHKHRSLSLDGDDECCLMDTIASSDDVEEIVVTRDNEAILQTAIQSLAPHYRMVLTLRYAEGLEYKQIADILGHPLGTVKSNIFRGRLLLQEILEKHHLLEV